MLDKKNILSVGITNAKKEEVLEYIITGLSKNMEKYYVVTPNPEILVLAYKNLKYRNILNNAKIAVSDGIGVMIAGNILGMPLKERFAGVELVENLCRVVAEKPITVGFLGGRGGVAEKTAECLKAKYPSLKVSFVGEEWPNGSSKHNVSSIMYEKETKEIHTTKYMLRNTDILFVAFGAPKQEMWISENLEKLPVKIAIGVGGSFDYISGNVSRAPRFIRKIGFEWLYRLVCEPWRIKRQMALFEFIYLVLKEKFS